MVRLWRGVLPVLALLAVVAAYAAGSLQVQVQPHRDQDNKFTGRYVAKLSVVGAAAARLVVFRLNVPTDYTVDTAAAANQTWLVDIIPGADIYKLPKSVDANESPVFFAELATDVANMNGLWGVGLLTDPSKDPKHVCDIVFTSGGRVTVTALAFGTGTVSVKDQGLTQLTAQGSFSTVAVPLYGDLNWNGQIDGGDFGLFAAAWSSFYGDSKTLDFADIAPLNSNADDLSLRTSAADGNISGQDFGLFAWAWNKFFAGTSQAPGTEQANKEGAQ